MNEPPVPDPPISPSEFLRTYSLYRKADLEKPWAFPSRLQWDCTNCKKETTWAHLILRATDYEGSDIHAGRYRCEFCKQRVIRFYLATDSSQKQVYKIGQHPEPSVAISKSLTKGLKDSVQHYKKGLICFNQGYGIAAVAYFRRVVEERTNELIDVVAEFARAGGAEESEIAKILAAKLERTYDKRLEVASSVIPTSLRPGNVNPLGHLHSLLSIALHGKPEEESLKTAEEMRFIIEHVFSNLQDHIEAQRIYAQKIQNHSKLL